ncbi:hypothetical protein HPB51_014642 [Rhipicephalus microplus]|uniref:Uncharacterized protein n=1 Tax=Rhipicephalus microplus TaxID=6941 RepID=A0A9J6F457_RHIMP|nr:hypothetical protein HPB51_014642 [Rhipicephalus microplus]
MSARIHRRPSRQVKTEEARSAENPANASTRSLHARRNHHACRGPLLGCPFGSSLLTRLLWTAAFCSDVRGEARHRPGLLGERRAPPMAPLQTRSPHPHPDASQRCEESGEASCTLVRHLGRVPTTLLQANACTTAQITRVVSRLLRTPARVPPQNLAEPTYLGIDVMRSMRREGDRVAIFLLSETS